MPGYVLDGGAYECVSHVPISGGLYTDGEDRTETGTEERHLSPGARAGCPAKRVIQTFFCPPGARSPEGEADAYTSYSADDVLFPQGLISPT